MGWGPRLGDVKQQLCTNTKTDQFPAMELLRGKTNTIPKQRKQEIRFNEEKTKSNKNTKTKKKTDSKTKTKRFHVLECAGVGWCDLRQLEAGAPGSRPHLAYQTTAMHQVM